MCNRLVFLDFDGVITTRRSRWSFDMEKIELVNHICSQTGAKIVVTSSWRIGYQDIEVFKDDLLHKFKRLFMSRAGTPDFERDMEKFKTFLRTIVGRTDSMGSMRGDEIKRYVDAHDGIESYAIIDDDSDMLDEQLFNFVQTDTYEGLTDREARICVDILNGKKIVAITRINDELKFRWRLSCMYPDIDNNIRILVDSYYKDKFKTDEKD